MNAKLVGHVLYVENANGAQLHWGVCTHCGMVEELPERRCQQWQRTGACDFCTEEMADEERREETRNWRMMSAWHKAVFPPQDGDA